MRPTYRVLNKQLTLMGCDRQVFICGLMIGAGFLMALGSIVTGGIAFGCFVFLGWLKAKDPVSMRLMFNPGKFRPHYDAGVREPFLVIPKRSRAAQINQELAER